MQEDNTDNNLNNEQQNSMFSDVASSDEILSGAENADEGSFFGAADSVFEEPKEESSEIKEELKTEEEKSDKNNDGETDNKEELPFEDEKSEYGNTAPLSDGNDSFEKEKINLKFDEEYSGKDASDSLITVRPVRFQEFDEPTLNLSMKKNLDIMQDIPMHITVELGRTKSSIKDIINMDIGSIVELNKIAGEQVEIYANEKLIARGEVIVIEDKFGVRVVNTNIQKNVV